MQTNKLNLNHFLEEARKLAAQEYENEKNNYEDEEISFEDFAKSQMTLLDDCKEAVEKEIIKAIDNSDIDELREDKKILSEINKICDNYFYNNIALD